MATPTSGRLLKPRQGLLQHLCPIFNDKHAKSYIQNPGCMLVGQVQMLRGMLAAISALVAAAVPMPHYILAHRDMSCDQLRAECCGQGLISGVPRGSLVMLDLYAEVSPQWKRYSGFFGAPWIWCMLHNFGGNIGEQLLSWLTLGSCTAPARGLCMKQGSCQLHSEVCCRCAWFLASHAAQAT